MYKDETIESASEDLQRVPVWSVSASYDFMAGITCGYRPNMNHGRWSLPQARRGSGESVCNNQFGDIGHGPESYNEGSSDD